MKTVASQIVLLHGFTCDPSTWDDWPGALAPALPFHGTDIPATEPTLDGMAAAVADWLAPRASAPVLVGHSLGGMLALALALAHPDRIRSIVLVDAYPSLALNDRVLPGGGSATSVAVQQRAEAMMTAGNQRLGAPLRARLWESIVRFDVTDRLGELRMPVYAIYGGRGLYRTDESERLKRDLGLDRIENCTVRVAEGAGHFVHWEAPALFRELVDESAR